MKRRQTGKSTQREKIYFVLLSPFLLQRKRTELNVLILGNRSERRGPEASKQNNKLPTITLIPDNNPKRRSNTNVWRETFRRCSWLIYLENSQAESQRGKGEERINGWLRAAKIETRTNETNFPPPMFPRAEQ